MKRSNDKVAVVAGVGDGLGLALCERLLGAGYAVGGLSRSAMPRPGLGDEYLPLPCDLTEPAAVDNAVSAIEQAFGPATVYVHNAAYLLHKAFLQTSARDFRTLWEVACLGAVHGVQRVLSGMLAAGQGSVLFAGATASVKAGGGFAAFASAKFALRGLGQSLAREYGPQGIHVAHVVIDGVIWSSRAEGYGYRQDQCLAPQAIAETFLNLIEQPRSAWTQELDLRPDAEPF